MYNWKVVRFFSHLFKKLLTLVQRLFPEERVDVLIKTDNPQEEKVPDYIINAFRDVPYGYLTPYQVSLYHPLAEEKPRKAIRETVYELENLFNIGFFRISERSWPLKKVTISNMIYRSLEQELRLAEGEGKERFGLLHGHINSEIAYVEELTDTAALEEKGFFKTRDSTGMSFAVKAYQMIVKNLDRHLHLGRKEVIGTYHTHLIPYRRTPSQRDSALLLANPGTPHLIICGQGIFAYTFKNYRKIFFSFPVKTPLEIIFG